MSEETKGVLSPRQVEARLAYYKGNIRKSDICANSHKPGGGETCAVSDLERLVEDGQKFGAIYADPPWQYSNQGTRAATNNHYETMTIEEIAALPIKKLTADKAHLHLWTTNGFLPRCFEILEAWDFEYKGVFVWVKNKMGIGNYWRVSHEFLVLGVKGNLPFYEKNQMSWLISDRTKHSMKPEEVATIVEKNDPCLTGRLLSWNSPLLAVWDEFKFVLFFNRTFGQYPH
jgi:N6-adenosine-specific RNA methylase IME4